MPLSLCITRSITVTLPKQISPAHIREIFILNTLKTHPLPNTPLPRPRFSHTDISTPARYNTGYHFNTSHQKRDGGYSYQKGSYWLAPLLGATTVLGLISSKDNNTTQCQANEHLLNDAEVRSDKPTPINVWQEILLPDCHLIVLSVLAAVASSVIGLLLPNLFGNLVDKAKEGAVVSLLKIPALKAIGVLLLQGIVQYGYISLINLAAERMVIRVKSAFFSHILSQDMEFFDKYKTGDILSMITADIQLIRMAFKHTISMGVRSTVSFAGGAVSLFMISKELSFLMLLVVPGVVAIGTVYARYLKSLSRKVQASAAHLNSMATEVISNMRTVRSFTNEPLEKRRFSDKSKDSLALSQKMGNQLGILQGLTSVALNGIGLIVYWYGGYQVSLGHITAGALTSFMMHTLSLQNSAQHLSILMGQVLAANGAVARLEEVARVSPKIGGHTTPNLLKLPHVKGVVELRNVTFAYPSREHQQVLLNFNLSLPAGKVTALAGPSGGGKTTVTSLIERFYDPQSGEVTLDDVPLTVLDPIWVRSLIGVVSQEPALFATTIKENIAYGKPGATDEEIIAAAQRAHAHNFVTAFPDGYDTMVGERGAQLSGGQKQRIAIARAILKNPRILVLDEATSALDTESEAQVQEALQELMKGRTVLVIAHRLSTVQNADNIAVVCDGQVVETGTHADLMKRTGVYAQLVSRQLH